MGKKKERFQALCVYDAMGFIRQLWLAAERTGEVVSLIMSDTTRLELYVREVMIGQIGPVGGGTRYVISEQLPSELAQRFKRQALAHGATPEAVRLLGQLTPLSKQEESEMAEKLTAKKSGDAKALKDAAKSTPVKGKGATKPAAKTGGRKGNPEALAKAREAQGKSRDASRARKIKALKKPKDITARDGTFRNKMLQDVLRAKTVGEFYDLGTANNNKYDAGCLKFAIDNGFVSVSD